MSRLSFRPRPLDVHKKLPIVKSIKDFEDYDETPTSASTRNSQILRLAAADADNEGNQIPSKKVAADIPTPQFIVVDSYERDYACTFTQTTSYLRGRGLRSEVGEFIEYDLDNEDEDWLQLFNESSTLAHEKFEALLFKLEVLDHKARERAGILAPTFGSPISILLQLDAVVEGLQNQQLNLNVLQSVYNYWKYKRERWRKPILRWLQPPPPVNDTNPFNVFRPREKVHRLHTRRMQRRENNVQSFEKLRQVRRNLDQAKTILATLIKREEKKRDVINNEVTLQRLQMKYKNESEVIQDSLTWPGLGVSPRRSEYEAHEVDDISNYRSSQWAAQPANQQKQATRHGWLHKIDPREPVLLFTKPLDQVKLAAAGISPPVSTSASGMRVRFRGRMGRGGRIIFDRWNPLAQAPVGGSAPLGVRKNTQQLFTSLA